MTELPHQTAVRLLGDWLVELDQWWNPAGWFGAGYNHWGMQTSLKYAGAAAVVAARHPDAERRSFALARSEAAFRHAFAAHVSGTGRCADGAQWGHTWISALALERAIHGWALVRDSLPDSDRAAFDRVLASEADWLSTEYHRGSEPGVQAALWGRSGKNDPESNLWNGALLWRATTLLDDAAEVTAARRDRWRERSLEFLANGVSVAADAAVTDKLDGRPLSQRHRGPNFFDSYSLDHHGYLNLGYMVVCTSQAALLHFDHQAAGLPVPELLPLHQAELWDRIRSCVTPDGRLVRIGGDSRVRYTYCQEFLPHSAMYAATALDDPAALEFVHAHLALVQQERDWTAERGEAGFYGARLAALRAASPYYYVRLETDRANALGFIATYGPTLDWELPAPRPTATSPSPQRSHPVWSDDVHGFAMVRGERRLASYCWQAFTTTQGLCVPVAHGDMAEYHLNLTPHLDIEGQAQGYFYQASNGTPPREVIRRWIGTFDGGFATVGEVAEGTRLAIAEGWTGGPAATSTIAFVALPDDATVLGVHRVVTSDWWVGVRDAFGLNLQVPNDVANGGTRTLRTDHGERALPGPAEQPGTEQLGRWAVFDEVLAVASLDAQDLFLRRDPTVGGGPHHSLGVETVAHPGLTNRHYQPPGTVVVDSAFLVRVGDGDELADFDRQLDEATTVIRTDELRAWRIGRWFVVINLGASETAVAVPGGGTDLTTGDHVDTITVRGGQAVVVDTERDLLP